MKSLTIRLPDALAQEIEHESLTRNVSKSDVVRERLHHLPRPGNTGGTMRDLIGDLIGSVRGDGLSDILEESWAAKVPGKPRRFLSPKKQKLAEIIRAKKLYR
jgi:hypothetical protein